MAKSDSGTSSTRRFNGDIPGLQQKGTRLDPAMTLPSYLPFLLLLAAVLGLWIHHTACVSGLAAALLAGSLTAALDWLAAVWVAVLAALALAYVRTRDHPALSNKAVWQTLAGIVFALYALAMSLPLLPGFH